MARYCERRCDCVTCWSWRFARSIFVAGILALALVAIVRHWNEPEPLVMDDGGFLEAGESAQPAGPGDSDWIPSADAFSPASQLWPPAEFQGDNASLVVFAGRAGVEEICGRPPEGLVRLGCQGLTKDGIPVIAIANPCLFPKDDFFAGIACHELAHGNGWKHG